MPEGHTIHRLARLQRASLAGQALSVDSPQGRFVQGAAELDGRVLTTVQAYGKHLFYRWGAPRGAPADETEVLHVHLGLFGRFRSFTGEAPPPTAGTRLRLVGDDVTVHLAGATTVELVTPPGEEALRARLGPDPLSRGARPEEARAALSRRRSPIGAALLDQRVLVGIGNVYRAEVLFLAGLHPDRPARDVTDAEFAVLWDLIVRQLRAGERSGRIVTVDPADVGVRSRSRVPSSERVYVYRRAGLPCRRCATTITSWASGGRTISACPTCQPR